MSDEGLPSAAAGPSDPSSSSLLSHLADSLANSNAATGPAAARGTVKLHVLFSVPRQARELYPFAHVDADDAYATSKSTPVKALVEHIFVTASFTPAAEERTAPGSEEREARLIYALECFLYTLPAHESAIMYVSKIDSSGWGPTPTPTHLRKLIDGQTTTAHNGKEEKAKDFNYSTSITKVLTQSFLSYFASLSHWTSSKTLPSVRHISLHILARAQRAYLFPSSEENKNKHVLSDGQLIKWWRAIVSEVSCGVQRRFINGGGSLDVRSFYIIPGYNDLESHPLVPLPPRSSAKRSSNAQPTPEQALAETHWVYGHPYSHKGAGLKSNEPLPPLPLSGPSFDMQKAPLINQNHIATLLPHFPDDPKSRFIAEIARDSHEHAKGQPQQEEKREGSDETTSNGSGNGQGRPKRRSATPSTPTKRLKAENSRASSRRNTPGASSSASPSPSPVKLTSTQRIHMRERGGLNKVSPDEFWERMGFRQECCSGNAVGVFVALFTLFPHRDEAAQRDEGASAGGGRSAMEAQPFALPHPAIKDMVYKHLIVDACEWSDAEKSVSLTKTWDGVVERNLKRKAAGPAAEEARSKLSQKEKEDIGRDHVWKEVELQGPTSAQIKIAEEKWKELSSAGKAPNGGEQAEEAKERGPTVNTLSVKRKRKT
ncbi:hypothetical protein FA10DRAFT_229268 [Acaromyces ingoldii]|uniref:histone acetyltransferase n=1 Tax=Acaromyces ingoldii TaxID=215250 RepID=A0A316YNB7_9BASI|nr:hypothetical protein FA10DRAFT_229268 [Acaromyces ingoldii]PWN90158.1 hypothetical protein FA10DRAFT_229268 [Acaromyces ingoldii]